MALDTLSVAATIVRLEWRRVAWLESPDTPRKPPNKLQAPFYPGVLAFGVCVNMFLGFNFSRSNFHYRAHVSVPPPGRLHANKVHIEDGLSPQVFSFSSKYSLKPGGLQVDLQTLHLRHNFTITVFP